MGMRMGGGGSWGLMHRFGHLDERVLDQKLPPGIVRRIAGFAAPYRRLLVLFLGLILVGVALTAVNPLIYRAIIDDGILKHDGHVVIELALLVGSLAVLGSVFSLWQRWVSTRVGEGLIFDMRTRVFAHIQEMPVAFFTRTQTGALVSRLNNDVLGAQQAFTDTMSSVIGNLLTVIATLAAMLVLSWRLTLVSLAILPLFVFPARWMGRRVGRITP